MKRPAGVTSQEMRLFKLAQALVPKLKKKPIPLRGGHWEIGYDFAKKPHVVWQANSRNRDRFALIPSERRILGLGALRYGYAEKKLAEALDRPLST
jgi:hypothetical protein